MGNIIRFALLAVLVVGIAFGQITGDVKGIVLDSSSATISKATVTLKSLETGETRVVATGADGLFTFGLLKIGRYEVRAEATGFRVTSTPVEVRAGEVSSVQFHLEVGQVTETVTVTDAVMHLDVENAQLQTSVSGPVIQEIPVARDPNLFALTAPGTIPVSANNPFLGSGSFNSNGGRGRSNNITVDGITATDVSVSGTGGVLTPMNFSSIKEVKVITNNFNAEYGRNSGAQVLYISKNGTNALHGELFEYFRNDKLNARPFFDDTGKTNIVRRNEYGYSVGGPVYIPGVFDGRNRAFWYTDYQGLKIRGAGSTKIASVPTPADVAGVTDSTARALLEQYQIPASSTGQVNTAGPNKTDFWQYSVRGDFNLTANDTVWMRYSKVPRDSSAADGLTFIGTNLPNFGATSEGTPRQATAAYTRLLGAAAVNEFRFGFGQADAGFPIDTPYPLGPRVMFMDGSVDTFGVWEGLPQGRQQRTYQFNDNLTLVRGRHTLKIGGEYYYLQADSFFDALQRPLLQFASFADFQKGLPMVFQQRFGNSVRENRVKNFFAFVQDDWKVARNLTVNLGMRFEFAGGPVEKNGMISNLNLDSTEAFGAAGAGPFGILDIGKPSFANNYNWGPRLGFAWNPGTAGRTVVRGGYGIAYDFVFLNPITNQRFLPPFIVTGVLSGQANFTGANSLANIVAGNAAIQKEKAAEAGKFNMTAVNLGAVSPAIDMGLRNPQAQHWNLGVQRDQFGIVWKASYVGTKGNYLPRSRDLNLMAAPPAAATSVADETARLEQFQSAFAALNGNATRVSNRIDPRYNAIVLVDSSAASIYHALQLEANKRLSRGLLLNVNYTWGKSIDNGSDVLGVLINDSQNQQNPLNNRDNRAVSQFDLSQRLVITHHWEPRWFSGAGNWWVRNIAGNWAFSGITSFRSGFPVTIEAGARRGLNPLTVIGGGGAVRPNAAGPVNLKPVPAGSAGSPYGRNSDAVAPISAYAASLGLSQPLLGNFGGLGRNALRLNGERNFDWQIQKNLAVTEGARFQISAEFYNIFNNTSFLEISRQITAPDFGQYMEVSQPSRVIQLGLRFVF